uniref:Uncharacterized protein n=1 Tax=Rhizophora mucronata TaxID=61149 RepID=A0A2P2QFW5_RHIMU
MMFPWGRSNFSVVNITRELTAVCTHNHQVNILQLY